MSVDKGVIRAAMRERRRDLPAAEVAAAGRAVYRRLVTLPAYVTARSVAAYLAQENEVPTDAILEEAERAGRAVYLPRCGGDPVLVRWKTGDGLVTGPGGVLQPASMADEIPEPPTVVLLPIVAWDATGARLGRGSGFYDRLLVGLPAEAVRVGLAYDFQEVPRLPRERWDVSLHYVITERRLVCAAEPQPTAPASLGIEKGGRQLA